MEEQLYSRSDYEKNTGRLAFQAQEETWNQVWQIVNEVNAWPDSLTTQGFVPWEQAPESTVEGWKVLSVERDRFADHLSKLQPLIDGGYMVPIETLEEFNNLTYIEENENIISDL